MGTITIYMKKEFIEELVMIFKIVKDYDIPALTPSWKRCWSGLLDRISSTAHQLKAFDFVNLYQKLNFLRVVNYKLYEMNIKNKCKENIQDLKIDEDVRKSFISESSQIKHDHFDYDNILLIDNIKKEFTTFKYIETIGKIEQANRLYAYLNNISIEVGIELTNKMKNFLNRCVEILTKENYEKFEEYLDEEIKEIHKEVFGWP